MHDHQYHPPAPDATALADRLNLHRAGRGWRGNCPCCGYRSSFALDVREGRILGWCSNCGDKAAVAAALRAAAGGSMPAARPEKLPRLNRADPASRIERARAIWDGGEPIEADCPAALYLARRRIEHVANSSALRWRADCPHPSGGRRLALLAAVTGPAGEFAGVQRVFLKLDGSKADCEPVKASLGVIAGGAVRLQTASDTLVIGEGIESAAAAGAILGLPAWAAVSAGNLAKSMMLPAEIRSVVIAADHDAAGLRAAETAWRRWRAEGRSVRIVKPNQEDSDFNDLQREAAREIGQ